MVRVLEYGLCTDESVTHSETMPRSRKSSFIVADKRVDYTSGRPDVLSFDVAYRGDGLAVSAEIEWLVN